MIRRGKGLALSRVMAVSVLALSVVFLFSSQKAVAAGNPEISFEGKVVTAAGINVPDGTYAMEFKIYTGCTNEPTSSTGCTAVWTEDYTSTTLVTFTSGTFQVNLGSITPFNTSVPWDTSPLYLSMQISNTEGATCTPAGNFTTNCNGDGVMNPFIELTASPYAEDSALLNGLDATAFGQLTSTQSWSGTNTFQPATNVTGAIVEQTSGTSPTADVFDVQGAGGSSDNFIQVTSTATNAGAINIDALGGTTTGNNVTITGGTATAANQGGFVVLKGGAASATTGSSGGGITITGANGTTAAGTGGAGGGITLTSGSANGNGTAAENAGTVSIDTGVPIDGGTASITIGPTNATLTTIKGGTTSEQLNSIGATLQTNTNSQTGFQVQNAIGSPIFQVDTTSTDPTGAQVNYLTYPGFEVPNGTLPQGWSDVVGGTLTQNTNQQFVYNGIDSAKLAATATGDGLSTTSFVSTPPAQAYWVSFEVEPATGVSIEPSQFTVTIIGTSTKTCSPTGTTPMSTAGFTQLSCQVAATSASPTTLEITENIAGNNTFYFDSVQMQSVTFNGATLTGPSGYQIGGIQLRGIIENPVDIESSANSTTAFQVQNSDGRQMFNIDSLNNVIQIGSQTASANPILLGLNNYNNGSTDADPTSTCSATVDNGSLYYNAVTDNVRACLGGTWQDLVSTAALSQLLFGVVPNSGTNPGDLVGASATTTAFTGGPCKVTRASTTSVDVNSCLAYSGGREVSVAQTTLPLGTIAADDYENVCLNSSGVPTLMGGVSATDGAETGGNLTITSGTTLGQPLLCLATIRASTTANDLGTIYDIRTFTTTTKSFSTIVSATQVLGGLVYQSATAGTITNTTAATGQSVVGVLVASNGSAGTAGTVNALYATSGPQWIKGTAGAASGDWVIPTTTTGYVSGSSTTAADAYDMVGVNLSGVWEGNNGTDCTVATFGSTDCQGSIFTNLDIQ